MPGGNLNYTFSAEVTNFMKGLTGISNGLGGLDKAISSTVTQFVGLATSVLGVVYASNKLGEFVQTAMSYVETVNMFAVTMGDATDQAEDFLESISQTTNLDPVALMRMQGIFDVLAKSIGVGTDNAYTMSEGLTQLAVDLASLWDMDVSKVQDKLESAIVGYSKAVRDLGIDVSVNALQNEAMLQGLNVNVETLDQASKMQLRYLAILRQSTISQGDFARTLEQPANMLRVFKEQVNVAARNLGSIFIPALSAVLPYLIAFARVAAMAFSAIATFFGFGKILQSSKDNALDASGGIKILGDSYDDLGSAATSAGKAVKKALSMQSFDEMNRMTSAAKSGGGGGVSGGTGSLGNLDLESYDMGLANVSKKVDELVQKILKLWDTFRQSEFFKGMLKAFAVAWEWIKEAAAWAWEVILNFWNWLEKNWNWAGPILIAIAAFWYLVTVLAPIILGIMAIVAVIAAIGSTAIYVVALVAAVIAYIIAGVLLVIFNWERIQTFFSTLWTNISNFFVTVWNSIVNFLVNTWNGILIKVYETWYAIRDFFVDLWESITGALETAWNAVIDFFETMWDKIVTGFTDLIENIKEFFATLPERIAYYLGIIIGKLIQWGKDMWNWITVDVPLFIAHLVSFFALLPIKIGNFFGDIIAKVVQWAIDMWDIISKKVPEIIDNVVTFFKELPEKIKTKFNEIVTKVAIWAIEMVVAIAIGVPKIIVAVGEWFGKVVDKVVSKFKEIVDAVVTWVTDLIEKIKTEVPKFITNVAIEFGKAVAKVVETGKNIVMGLWQGIEEKWEWLKSKVANVVKSFIRGVNDGMGVQSPSTVFAYTGSMLMAGLAQGITKSSKWVTNALGGVIDPNLSATYSLMGGATSSPATAGSSARPEVAQPMLNENALYDVFVRALRELPPTVLMMDGEALATSSAATNQLQNRRYNKVVLETI